MYHFVATDAGGNGWNTGSFAVAVNGYEVVGLTPVTGTGLEVLLPVARSMCMGVYLPPPPPGKWSRPRFTAPGTGQPVRRKFPGGRGSRVPCAGVHPGCFNIVLFGSRPGCRLIFVEDFDIFWGGVGYCDLLEIARVQVDLLRSLRGPDFHQLRFLANCPCRFCCHFLSLLNLFVALLLQAVERVLQALTIATPTPRGAFAVQIRREGSS